MRLQLLSDLHLETASHDFTIQDCNADILVVPGDVAEGTRGIMYLSQFVKRYKHIIYVPGNHEYYNNNLSRLSLEMRHIAKEEGIVFLDNDIFELEEHVFIGSTLWTDFRLYGSDMDNIGRAMNSCTNGIADFHSIRYAYQFLKTSHVASFGIQSQNYIEQMLSKYNHKKKIVCTHFAPSIKSVHPKYAGNDLNPYFANKLDWLVAMSDLWLHGHVHSSFDYYIDDKRVLANPVGYGDENSNFNPKLVIKI